MKIVNIDKENLYIFWLNDLRNFKEILKKDVTYDIIKSYKKAGLHRVSRRCIFETSQNWERGVKLTFPALG